MDFQHSPRAQEYLTRFQAFMDDAVLPAEPVYAAQRRDLADAGRPNELPRVVEDLKAEARRAGLWNLFLPDSTDPAHGLRVGLQVFHNKFGEGKVLTLEGEGADARAQISFPRHGTKWLALSVAKLTPVE